MRLINAIFIILSLLSISCETSEKIDDFPLRPSKLVVNCFFNADSIWEFQVSKSLSVLDNAQIKLIKNATIKIFRERDLLCSIFSYDKDGWYRVNENLPEAGKEFLIQVSSPDYKDILYAKDVVPQKIEISKGKVIVTDSVFNENVYYRYGFIRGSFEISFSDPADIHNYYQLKVFNFDSVFNYFQPIPEFSHLERRLLALSSDNLSVENSSEYVPSLLLNDFIFDGQEFSLSINFEDQAAQKKKDYYVELTSLSREGYLYFKTINEYFKSRRDPFSEPVMIYTNIENGFGIFSAYSRSVFKISTPF